MNAVVHVCHYRVNVKIENGIKSYSIQDIRTGSVYEISYNDYSYIVDELSCEACDLIWRWRVRENIPSV